MANHDYVIDNQAGIAFRNDLNAALSAIVTNNSSPTEPTITHAYMWWADTTSAMLKLRNSSNNDWVEVLVLATGESAIGYLKPADIGVTVLAPDGDGSLLTNLSLVDVLGIDDLTDALFSSISGGNLLAIGLGALGSNTTGTQNIAIGEDALKDNTMGTSNIAIGLNALADNINGNGNLAIGEDALTYNISGTQNIAIGFGALTGNTVGFSNLAVGYAALTDNTTGSDNTAMGIGALLRNTIGIRNTAVGYVALTDNTTGSDNTAVGYAALAALDTGIDNVAMGNFADANALNGSNRITIGANIDCVGDNYFTFGKDGHRVYNNFTANASWTRVSDRRIKKNIKNNTDCGLGFINSIRTVTYKFKAPSELGKTLTGYNKEKTAPEYTKKMYGFIAQEIKKALKDNYITDFAGHHQIDDGKDNMQGISYEMFVIPLVKSVQELTDKNKELEQKLEHNTQLIKDFNQRICDLENRILIKE